MHAEFQHIALFFKHVHISVENRGTLSGCRLTLWLSFSAYAFFYGEQKCAHTFPLRNHLVATGLRALHLLHSPTAWKNSCLVGVGTTCVTKLAVSRLLSEIQHSSRACSIGNEPQNTRVFSFFDSMHCAPVRRAGSVTLCPPLYIFPNFEKYDWVLGNQWFRSIQHCWWKLARITLIIF